MYASLDVSLQLSGPSTVEPASSLDPDSHLELDQRPWTLLHCLCSNQAQLNELLGSQQFGASAVGVSSVTEEVTEQVGLWEVSSRLSEARKSPSAPVLPPLLSSSSAPAPAAHLQAHARCAAFPN